MKKIIILLVLALSLNSCSKDETPNENLKLTFENLAGKWYFIEIIKANGETIPNENVCPTQRDYVEFYITARVRKADYSPDCVDSNGAGINPLYIEEDLNILRAGYGNEIPDSYVLKFTQNELQLQFEEDLAPGTETRVLILRRD
jgi:hypothetical protein